MRQASQCFPSRILTSVFLVVMIFGYGCSSSGTKSYPVQGKVVATKAEDLKQLAGQGVELQSVSEPNTRAFGPIQPDGSFTLATYRNGETLPGAIEGKHKARLMLGMGEEDENRTRKKKWTVDPKYTRFETSPWEITVPVTGEVVLKLP